MDDDEADPVELSPWPRLARWCRGLGAPAPYQLTRFVVLRALGFVYLAAFLSLALQVLPLLGAHGLSPARDYVGRVVEAAGSPAAAFLRQPSLFWFGCPDGLLVGLAWAGVGLSALVLGGLANAPILLALWAVYLSFIRVGQVWYGYGWEIQLCETGFLAAFLAPALDPRPFPRRAPAAPAVWLFWWLIARIMLGAGLIKLRGDACWRDLTCLDHHFETQPIPNPLSPLFHALPRWAHAAGVLFNHAAELGAPLLLIGPRRLRHAGAAVIVAFQGSLIVSGNLSFLNWLTVVPALACFDDGAWARVLPRAWVARARAAAPASPWARRAAWALAAAVALLSVPPVRNLLSGRQVMNTSFDRLALVNTYGAFGSVGRDRDEIVFEGTRDADPGPGARWRPYEFRCKPGDVRRRPCVVSPLQPRLDWQVWFAAMGSPADAPWTLHLVWKLLHRDRGVLSLLAGDPFPEGPPRYVRARLWRYRFARAGEHGWWHRELLGEWLPPLSADDPQLRRIVAAFGWPE